MADVKITALGAKANVEDDDLLVIVDDPGGTPVTKKVTIANAKAGILGAHKTLSTTHDDTLADTVVRGDIIIGNSTPAWARLAKGAANSVLWSNGTDISWSAAPRLANIADTGGTNRITLATSSPHIALTGNVTVSGDSAFGGATITANSKIKVDVVGGDIGINVNFTGGSGSTTVLKMAGSPPELGTSKILVAVSGVALCPITGGLSGQTVYALKFQAGLSGGTGSTVTEVACVYAQPFFSAFNGTLTNLYGVYIPQSISLAVNAILTNYYGIYINIAGHAQATTVYGLRIADVTAGGTKINLLVGPATPTATSGTFKMMGNFTAAANQTPIYISEGATPTLRQLKTFNPGAAGINFTNGQLVCVLV